MFTGEPVTCLLPTTVPLIRVRKFHSLYFNLLPDNAQVQCFLLLLIIQ